MFIGVSDREERHGNIRKLKEKKRNDEDLKNYREWLKRASEFVDSKHYLCHRVLACVKAQESQWVSCYEYHECQHALLVSCVLTWPREPGHSQLFNIAR